MSWKMKASWMWIIYQQKFQILFKLYLDILNNVNEMMHFLMKFHLL